MIEIYIDGNCVERIQVFSREFPQRGGSLRSNIDTKKKSYICDFDPKKWMIRAFIAGQVVGTVFTVIVLALYR
uniref:Uncharacterized protein n=1 Tax=uncultured marine virus TaxID=186617 RepID=A0A0F7L478_9VIRU|nr:hypothetical protein [uncultured marine virus]